MTNAEWVAALAAGCSPQDLSDEEPQPEMAMDEPSAIFLSIEEDFPCPF